MCILCKNSLLAGLSILFVLCWTWISFFGKTERNSWVCNRCEVKGKDCEAEPNRFNEHVSIIELICDDKILAVKHWKDMLFLNHEFRSAEEVKSQLTFANFRRVVIKRKLKLYKKRESSLNLLIRVTWLMILTLISDAPNGKMISTVWFSASKTS